MLIMIHLVIHKINISQIIFMSKPRKSEISKSWPYIYSIFILFTIFFKGIMYVEYSLNIIYLHWNSEYF